jgi:alpha-mannosidase
MILHRTAAPCGTTSWFTVEPAGVVLDTVKKAEDSDDLIVRLYEANGTRARVRLRSPLPVRSVARCNLLEEEQGRLHWRDGGVDFDLGPFRIVTLKLGIAASGQNSAGRTKGQR